METEPKVPSDLPTDPLPEGDAADSPVPDVRDQDDVEVDQVSDPTGEEAPE